MLEVARAFKPEAGFCGRVGALITRKNGIETVYLATEPIPTSWLCPFETITQTGLWPLMQEKDVPFIRLRNKEGETLLLTQLLEKLFAPYPVRPDKQGGEVIERRKAFWRYALVDALKSPSVQLLREFIKAQDGSIPVATNFGAAPLRRTKCAVTERFIRRAQVPSRSLTGF